MSTFDGFIEEIPDISVDRFEGHNMSSTAFFLSHYHSDHIKGLGTNLRQIIEKENVFIYASAITVAILKNEYPNIPAKKLEFDNPNSININENKYISVEIIPAGHCLGSVMFLFEINNKKILYTGDYRIDPIDFKNFKQFFDKMGNVIQIEHLYIDTTFFLNQKVDMPSRKHCFESICQCIKEWLDKDDKNVVNIVNCAYYTLDYLYIEIFNRFKMPIHVNEKQFFNYKFLPEMDGVVTLSENTKIHSSCAYFKGICKKENVRKIIPSSWFWNSDYSHSEDNSLNTFRFFYSTHPSYEEIVAFIKFLKPQKVSFNVLPNSFEEQNKMTRVCDEIMKSYLKITRKNSGDCGLFTIDQIPLKKKVISSQNKIDDDLLQPPPIRNVKKIKM